MGTKSSTAIVVSVLFGSLAILASCKTNTGESPGVTTIRSGSPEGVRVTSAPGTNSRDAADQMTGALCKHERECASARSRLSDEALLLQEQACVTEVKPTAELSLNEISCSPAVARAGLKECLAAIEGERCYESMNRFPTIIPACRSTEICRRGEAITQR